ncbi:MAG: hypothetical protein ACRC92_27330 [Peptostreptococcaceae bacterium]
MAKSTCDIWRIYELAEQPMRDEKVQVLLANYFKKNISTLADGIINQVPTISANSRDEISNQYNISTRDFKSLNRLSEMKKMAKLASELKLGLIISYLKTGKAIYLNYLFILFYSSLMHKYFKNGYNKMVLKYTIESQDNRTDFKKYDMSLIVVINKKVETFIEYLSKARLTVKEKNGAVSDLNIRLILQAVATRVNGMIRTIANKYYDNMKDDNIKVMMQYTKTLDGKDVISPMNVIETVRDTAVDNLRVVSYQALNMSGLTLPAAIPYRKYIVDNFADNINSYVTATNMIVNEWLKRNPKVSLDHFKRSFVKEMSVARNLNHIYEEIDKIYDSKMNEETSKKLNKLTFNKYVYKYLLANITASTLDVIKTK